MENGTQTLARRPTVAPAVSERLRGVLPTVATLLPPDITMEQFRAALYLELTTRRELHDCPPDSIVECSVKAAMNGMLPGRDCYFIAYRSKGKAKATYVENYFGIIRALDRTGKVAKSFAHPVYDGDIFEIDYLADVFSHKPHLGKKGKLQFFYGCILLKNGTRHIEVMLLEDIDAVKRRAPAHESGPWVTDYEMMARKTVLKRVAKYAKLTPEMERLLTDDEERLQSDIPSSRVIEHISDIWGDQEAAKEAYAKATQGITVEVGTDVGDDDDEAARIALVQAIDREVGENAEQYWQRQRQRFRVHKEKHFSKEQLEALLTELLQTNDEPPPDEHYEE